MPDGKGMCLRRYSVHSVSVLKSRSASEEFEVSLPGRASSINALHAHGDDGLSLSQRQVQQSLELSLAFHIRIHSS